MEPLSAWKTLTGLLEYKPFQQASELPCWKECYFPNPLCGEWMSNFCTVPLYPAFPPPCKEISRPQLASAFPSAGGSLWVWRWRRARTEVVQNTLTPSLDSPPSPRSCTAGRRSAPLSSSKK